MGNILSTIRTQAKALNAEADRASIYIECISQRLRDAGVGVEHWGPVISSRERTEYDDTTERSWRETDELLLGYAKVNNRWGFAVQWCTYDSSEELINEQPATLLENAGRDVRISAMSYVDEFLKDLSGVLKQKAEQLKKVGQK